MRIVDRRYLAALLGLWLVLAVGLAAQAAPPGATIETSCSPCVRWAPVVISGTFEIKNNTVLSSFWIRLQTDPDAYTRADAQADGTFAVNYVFNESGVYELVLVYFGNGGSIKELASTTVTVLEPLVG